MATASGHVAVQHVRSNGRDSLSRCCVVIVSTIVLASFFGLSVGVGDENEEHVPTLREIYGGIPKNSLPLRRRDSPNPSSRGYESRTFGRDSESSFKRDQPISPSLRREIRALKHSSPSALTGQVSNAGLTLSNSVDSEYYVNIQIGTPVQDVILLIDTGSNIIWTQSKQCISCFSEILPRYDYNLSSTFEQEIVNGSEKQWNIPYLDGSLSSGIVVRDTITIASGFGDVLVIPGFEFGLAFNDTGVNSIYSGILGLGPYPTFVTPFLTQLGSIENGTLSKFSKRFRHCFPDRFKQANATSFLSFGDIDESETDSLFSSSRHLHKDKTLWTPILPNTDDAKFPIQFYTVNLTAIIVAGTRIVINPKELAAEAVLNGTMTVIDSGTVISELREPYYSQFTEAYYNATINIGASLSGTNFSDSNVYYNISRDVFDATVFPGVSFIFQKWQPEGQGAKKEVEEIELFQPKDNLIIPNAQNADNTGVIYILNMSPALGSTVNLIGNYAQQNFLMDFDLEKKRIGFLRASCAFEY